MSDDPSPDEPLVLRGAQRAIRDAYVDAETGLFTLDCVPGAGKSVVAHHLAAEDILRRYQAGDLTPEQHVAVVSFNRDEAADIVPQVCARLRAIVEHDLVPKVGDVSAAEVRYLQQRIRQAPAVGTVDGLLRSLFEDIAHDLGFSESPAVGNDALLAQVHRDCYNRVSSDPQCTQALHALETAYPASEYVTDIPTLLETALTHCRDQRLSPAAFRETLLETRDGCYPTGQPEAIADLVTALSQFGGSEATADRLAATIDPDDASRLLDADRELYTTWTARIDDFCTVLAAYREAYRDSVRAHGAVTHTDVAFLIDAYFDGDEPVSTAAGGSVDPANRERVQTRYHARLQSVLIDEAQDVSAIQHAALTHMVAPDTRVFACGDVRQGIYRWRHADPTVFDEATTDGTYLGVEWDNHEHRTATTTYRCTPAIAAAINTIAEPVFDDSARGNIGDLETSYPPLEAARDHDGETPSVHLSAFQARGAPGSPQWIDPDDGNGEAAMLATHVAQGLADGTFRTATGDPLSITVLFRRRTHMAAYSEAFAAAGLRVRTTGEELFACPAVKSVWAVCDWLIDPASPSRTNTLLTDSALDVSVPHEALATDARTLDELIAADSPVVGAATQRVLEGLQTLRNQRDTTHRRPASVWLEDIVETLGLRATATLCDGADDPRQRVGNLDALVETVSEWEQDRHYTPRELTTLVEPFREDPGRGPVQPSLASEDVDVTFSTVHRAKGDEADVVVLADPGFDVWAGGPHTQRLFTHGSAAGLAPPPTVARPDDVAIPPHDAGLYARADPWERDGGLRWGTAHWADVYADSCDRDELLGPAPLTAAAASERAESWRLLYVALTRARDHLVVPVPRTELRDDHTRDRWLDTLRDGLGFTAGRTETYTLSTPASDPNRETIAVGVNDVDLFATRDQLNNTEPASTAATAPPDRSALDDWVPRFVNPSTLYPLTESPSEHVLAHLLGEPLHTETNAVPDTLPLEFTRLGPEEVGRFLHAVLTTLIDREVFGEPCRSMGPRVRATFDDIVDELAPQIDASEREGMYAFFERVLEGILDSDLWTEITNPATVVRVDHPIDGLVTVDDVEIELHGEADIVVDHPDGSRHVADLKIALAPLSDTSQQRYELQVAAYAYLFDKSHSGETRTRGTVETFGVDRNTITSSWPPTVIERRLSTFTDV